MALAKEISADAAPTAVITGTGRSFHSKDEHKKTEQRVCLGEELVMLHPGQAVVKQVLLKAEVCSD